MARVEEDVWRHVQRVARTITRVPAGRERWEGTLIPCDVSIHFPRGAYGRPDYKHGVVTASDHPRIPSGMQVEYHRDRANDGEDILRVNHDDEYRVSLDDGYQVNQGGDGLSMKCSVLDDEPWRVTNT